MTKLNRNGILLSLIVGIAAVCGTATVGFAESSRRPEWTMLVFRSKTCPVCDQLERQTLTNDSVRKALQGVRVSTIQVEDDPELALQFLATAYPRMVFLRDGSPEDWLMGALEPETFLEEWKRIASGGSTVSALRERVALGTEQCIWRGQLGIKQALLGEVAQAQLQLDRMVVVTDADRKAHADLQSTIHNAQYLRLRERCLLARSHGEVPTAFELEEFVLETDMLAATRYVALRLLIGVLEEQIEHEAESTRRENKLRQLTRNRLAAWSVAPRPLDDDVRGIAVRGVRGLLLSDTEVSDAERATAVKIMEELATRWTEADDVKECSAVVLWLSDQREAAIAKAKTIRDREARAYLLADMDARASKSVPAK